MNTNFQQKSIFRGILSFFPLVLQWVNFKNSNCYKIKCFKGVVWKIFSYGFIFLKTIF